MSDAGATRTEQLLEEAVRWLRVLAAPTVRAWLEPVLKTSDERRVYQASTGGSMQEVAASAGVSHQTVSNYWKKWDGLSPAIIKPIVDKKGRFQRLYDLDEVSLPLEVA